MDAKHLLAKSITLLYHESKILGTKDKSTDLVRNILAEIKLPEESLSLNHGREQLINLRNTALKMCEDPVDHEYDPMEVIQRAKLDCGDDEGTFEAISMGINYEMSDEARKKACLNIQRDLGNHFRDEKVKAIIKEVSSKYLFHSDQITDRRQFIQEIISKLEPYTVDAVTKDPAIISEVLMSDDEDMQEAFDQVVELSSGGAVFKTGWQALNRALRGGFRRGEQWVIGALQHKFKTGFTLSIFRQIAQYNKAIVGEHGKKPMLMRISFEDNIGNNMDFLYAGIHENEYGTPAPKVEKVVDPNTGEEAPTGETTRALYKYVQEKMMVNGWEIAMLRVNPSDWTYKDIQNKVIEYESKGYDVQLLMIDYLPLIPTTGCTEGPAGVDIRDLYRRMRNFTSARGICMITPHQFSTDAKSKIRDGATDFVKQINEQGYYAGSKQIDQEVDGELGIHIEISNGKSYLTVQRGKHRFPGAIEEKDKYFVLPFSDKTFRSGIMDDEGKPEIALRKVGGGVIGSPDENPMWSFDTEAAF